MPEPHILLALILTAGAAGAINSLAGGGTLLTFPALLAVMGSVDANGTSTVALMPGSLASAWAYRRELRSTRNWLRLLIIPSAIGGLIGVWVVTSHEEQQFRQIVPWLIASATLLLLLQPLIIRLARPELDGHRDPPCQIGLRLVLVVAQLGIAIYGGYFGAGIGILMLGTLGVMGLHDIHEMNALKAFLAGTINLLAAVVFAARNHIVWHFALAMMASAIAGGYLGARFGRKLNRDLVRWFVIVVGFVLAAYYFAETMR